MFFSEKSFFKGVGLVVAALGAFSSLSERLDAKETAPLNSAAPDRLPAKIDGRMVTPDLGCFWSFKLGDEGYKTQIDAEAPYGAFDSVLLTLRANNSILNNQEALETTKKAVEYARDRYGIGTLLDIDLRIARYDFEKERPDLAQERLFFKESLVKGDAEQSTIVFTCDVLSDHYTGNLPYYVRGGRVVRAWAYEKDPNGEIDPNSIVDITENALWDKTRFVVENKPGNEVDPTLHNELAVSFKRSALPKNAVYISCAVAFRYSYPDLFADETLALEKEIYERYRDVPAVGIGKDEWGFPPCFNRVDALDDFWYSENMRASYAKKYDNRDLLNDLFLAFRAQKSLADERIAAVDRYRRLCGDRVVEYEVQNYKLTKEIWGKEAFVGVHCTWYPWPNTLEMRKDGVMWWKAPRDVAQTDEYAPFCARNSMAKANDSMWINMFYARQIPPYIWEHWTAAASGGRVHVHQIYPRDENSPSNPIEQKWLPIVADGGVAKIRQKIRILNLISNSQLDASVAVIFGRFAASNPLREEYKVVGWELCDRFATQGYPADLIPIDEISSSTPSGNPRWTIEDGYLKYGPQKYQTIILNGGESSAEMDDYLALRALAQSVNDCKTQIVSLAPKATEEEKAALVESTIKELKERGVIAQTPWVADNYQFAAEAEQSSRPPRKSTSRFLDGTILWIAAEKSDFGDPIVLQDEIVSLDNGTSSPTISVNANGVFAVRFNEQGELIALAASELKSFNIGGWKVELSEETIGDDPVDVALWKDENGKWRGVFQRFNNDLPEALDELTPNWNYLQRR